MNCWSNALFFVLLLLAAQHCCVHITKDSRYAATVNTNTSAILWCSSRNSGQQYDSLKVWLILSDLHTVVSQNTGIYISKAVAKRNLGQTRCLQDGTYGDRLLSNKWSWLNVEPCIYIHIYIYICVCVCVCVYVFIYMYTHIRVSFCDGSLYDDSLLRPLSSRTEHSLLLVRHFRNSSVPSLLSALLALFLCACVSSFSIFVQFF